MDFPRFRGLPATIRTAKGNDMPKRKENDRRNFRNAIAPQSRPVDI